MTRRLVLPLALVLAVGPVAAACSPTPDGGATSAQGTAGSGGEGIPRYTKAPPSDAAVPVVGPSLESHPGDEANFYADTDDYVVWAKPSTHTKADREYRLVSFDGNGMQSSAFLKYVFSSEAGAKEFAATEDLLVQDGNVVYYKGWFGPEVQDKAGVVELAKAAGNEYYVSKP